MLTESTRPGVPEVSPGSSPRRPPRPRPSPPRWARVGMMARRSRWGGGSRGVGRRRLLALGLRRSHSASLSIILVTGHNRFRYMPPGNERSSPPPHPGWHLDGLPTWMGGREGSAGCGGVRHWAAKCPLPSQKEHCINHTEIAHLTQEALTTVSN